MANAALGVWRTNRSLYGADKLATAMRKAGHNVGREPASEAASRPAAPNPDGEQEPDSNATARQERNLPMDHQLAAVTIDRQRLIDALDTLADVAIAPENNADQHVPLDHDQLITALRGIISDLTFEVEASDLLG